MKCPSCGFENESDVKFCGNCGVKLEAGNGVGRKLFCSNCGRENPPGSRFCQDCGSEIGKPIVTAQPAYSPQVQPVLIKKRNTSWAWMLAGLAAVLIAASAFYFLKLKPAASTIDESRLGSSETAMPQDPGTCSPDEKLLYSEDFQDSSLDGWRGVPAYYSVSPASDDADNLVLKVQKPEATSGQVQAGPQLGITPFTNAALRLRFYIAEIIPQGDQNWFSFNWLSNLQPVIVNGQEVYDSRYQLSVGWNYFEMRRLQQPLANVSVDRSATYPVTGKWHALEIITSQPRTEVWLDGSLVMEYEDPQPLPPGTFSLEAWLEDPQVKLLFDDIVICELAASD